MNPNQKQVEVLQTIEKMLKEDSRKVLNIIGEGGTGKSWLINEINHKFGPHIHTHITATTGLAASNIGGKTIHSVLALKLSLNEDATELGDLQKLERDGRHSIKEDSLLLIDESSMIGANLYREILKAPFKLLVLFGDKQQLPPIKEVHAEFNCKTIELTEQMRQKKGTLYNLIRDFRIAKETDEHINPYDYADGQSVEAIDLEDLPARYHLVSNRFSKKVISYTNEEADNMVDRIKPTDHVYRLNSSINGYDGRESKMFAVNGEEIKVTAFPKSWYKAQEAFFRLFGYESKQRIKWSNDEFPIKVVNATIENIPMPYCKVFLGRESTIREVTEERLGEWMRERQRLVNEFGASQWKFNKDEQYMVAARALMSISNGVASARHSCSLTAHKAQGQTIEYVFVNMDDIARRDLMYVALSRASKKVFLVSIDGNNKWNK